MLYKKILFTKLKVAEICEVELPESKAGEVQVRLCVSSVSSGTERANLLGDVNVSVFEKIAFSPKYDIISPAKIIRAHILLPEGKTCDKVLINGKEQSFELQSVGDSIYVDFTIASESLTSMELIF